MNDVTLGVSMVVGIVILYIFVLSYVEGKIRKINNGNLERKIDKLNDKA
jgi:hypothetical protein